MEIILRAWSTSHGYFRVMSMQSPSTLKLKGFRFALCPYPWAQELLSKDPALLSKTWRKGEREPELPAKSSSRPCLQASISLLYLHRRSQLYKRLGVSKRSPKDSSNCGCRVRAYDSSFLTTPTSLCYFSWPWSQERVMLKGCHKPLLMFPGSFRMSGHAGRPWAFLGLSQWPAAWCYVPGRGFQPHGEHKLFDGIRETDPTGLGSWELNEWKLKTCHWGAFISGPPQPLTPAPPMAQGPRASDWRATRFETQPHSAYQGDGPWWRATSSHKKGAFYKSTVLEPTQKLPEQQWLSLWMPPPPSYCLHTQVSHWPLEADATQTASVL